MLKENEYFTPKLITSVALIKNANTAIESLNISYKIYNGTTLVATYSDTMIAISNTEYNHSYSLMEYLNQPANRINCVISYTIGSVTYTKSFDINYSNTVTIPSDNEAVSTLTLNSTIVNLIGATTNKEYHTTVTITPDVKVLYLEGTTAMDYTHLNFIISDRSEPILVYQIHGFTR